MSANGWRALVLIDQPAGAGTTLALQVDADGDVRYDAIAQHGRAAGSKVQSSFKGKQNTSSQQVVNRLTLSRFSTTREQVRRDG